MRFLVTTALVAIVVLLVSCSPQQKAPSRPVIVVTYAVLGDVVTDLVGDNFTVVVSMPNGLDPHEWEPSARDIEALNRASLIVRNGLGLEGGMEKTLASAAASGVPEFVASDHIDVRHVKEGQGLPTADADQKAGAADPHLWLDPLRMKAVVLSLAQELKSRFGVDLGERASSLAKRLVDLDARLRKLAATVEPQRRVLVTGHESLGYFADAYGFQLVGAIIPSLSTRAEVSASDLAALKATLVDHRVPVIFTELGTPAKVSVALAQELHVRTVEIGTHLLPPGGHYEQLLSGLMDAVVTALRE